MPNWTITAYAETNSVPHVIEQWRGEFEDQDEGTVTLAWLDNWLSKLAGWGDDWTTFGLDDKRKKPICKWLKNECEGLLEIVLDVMGSHHRVLGFFIKREFVILVCKFKDKRGMRTNREFYPVNCKEAQSRKTMVIERKAERRAYHV